MTMKLKGTLLAGAAVAALLTVVGCGPNDPVDNGGSGATRGANGQNEGTTNNNGRTYDNGSSNNAADQAGARNHGTGTMDGGGAMDTTRTPQTGSGTEGAR